MIYIIYIYNVVFSDKKWIENTIILKVKHKKVF